MFDWLKSLFSSSPPPTEVKGRAAPTDNPLAGTTAGFMSNSGVPALAREELRHLEGEVYSSVRPIAQRIAGQPIRVGRRTASGTPKGMKARLPSFIKQVGVDGVEPVEHHALLDVLSSPNPFMVQWSLMYTTACQLELAGASYWWIFDGDDGPQVWVLPPSWVRPEHDEDRLYARYFVLPPYSGVEFEVPADEMVRISFSHPADPYFSVLSPLQAMAKVVVADEQIVTSQYRGHLNGVNPGLALIVGRHPDASNVPGQRPILTKEQRNQLLSAIKQTYRGAANNEEPLILDGLIEDVKRITQTPREMDFLNSGMMTRDRIAEGFGVNPIIRGRVEGANRASSATADQHFCDTCVNPKLELLSQILTKHLAPKFEEGLLVWIEPATSFDPDVQRADLQQLIDAGCVTKNELRSAHGLPPLEDGGDELIQPQQPMLAAEVDARRVRSFRAAG